MIMKNQSIQKNLAGTFVVLVLHLHNMPEKRFENQVGKKLGKNQCKTYENRTDYEKQAGNRHQYQVNAQKFFFFRGEAPEKVVGNFF